FTRSAAQGAILEAHGTYMVDKIAGADGLFLRCTGTIKKRIDEDSPVIDLTACDNVRIEGATIDGNKSIQTGTAARESRAGCIQINAYGDGNTSTGVRLLGITVKDAHGPGIKGTSWVNFLARDVSVFGCEGRGWQFGSNCDGVTLDNPRVWDCWQTGISHNGVGAMSAPLGTSRAITINNPFVHDIHNDPNVPASGIGIEMIGETSGAVIGGTVFDCDSMGVSTGFNHEGRVAVIGTIIRNIAYSTTGSKQGFAVEVTCVKNGYYTPIISDCRVGYYVVSGGDCFLGGSITNPLRSAAPTDDSYERGAWFRAVHDDNPEVYGYGGPCEGHVFA